MKHSYSVPLHIGWSKFGSCRRRELEGKFWQLGGKGTKRKGRGRGGKRKYLEGSRLRSWLIIPQETHKKG